MLTIVYSVKGNRRKIGSANSIISALASIRRFLERRDYTPGYLRVWDTAPGITKVDFGSHEDFFFIEDNR